MEELMKEQSNKKSKSKSSKKTKEPKTEKSRSKTPPSKNDDLDKWREWYKEEIKERVANGEKLPEIAKSLNIREDSARAFIS